MDELFHFLIIEESMSSRIIVREQFSQLNQRVDFVSSIEDAIIQMTSHIYSMILVDSGFYHSLTTIDFNSLIRDGRQMNQVPLVAVMVNNGVDLYHQQPLQNYVCFTKPFSRESTLKIIEYLKNF
ncbi:hypothetical protein EAW55_04610 [Legionella jordanis]|nr:hypothetical protein [Legionella jordanis]RMX03656.1 hypothetical protein EAW55_04610 [Legionella jordanis]